MTPKKFRSKDSEIGHLKRKFLTCGRGCEGKLIELKTKFKEWNDKNTGTNEITMNDLKEAGFSAWQLKSAEFSAEELKEAGFLLANMGAFALYDLRIAGFSAQEITNAFLLNKQIIGSLEILKNAGFSAKDLSEVTKPDETEKLYTLQNLIKAGFSAQELKYAGFSAKELKDANAEFSAQILKDAGFSAQELKEVGFSAQELINAGFSVKVLELINRLSNDKKLYLNKH